MASLYPLKFKPIYKEKLWGGRKLQTTLERTDLPDGLIGESWELSAIQDELSVVSNGFLEGNTIEEVIEIYMSELVGSKVYEQFGLEFPLLIKFIDAQADLSIQVHPDDDMAIERHQAFGKTEMWYIVEAEKQASLIAGFSEEVNKGRYLKHLASSTLPEILNRVEVEANDVFFMPPGRVHAIGSNVLLAEIQQTSDITYRIYDWGRLDKDNKPRELHTELAVDAIDYSELKESKTTYKRQKNTTQETISCPYFTTNVIDFDKPVEKDYNFIDSFVILMCLEGGLAIAYNDEEVVPMRKGETVLLPADLKNVTLIPLPSTKILEIYIK